MSCGYLNLKAKNIQSPTNIKCLQLKVNELKDFLDKHIVALNAFHATQEKFLEDLNIKNKTEYKINIITTEFSRYANSFTELVKLSEFSNTKLANSHITAIIGDSTSLQEIIGSDSNGDGKFSKENLNIEIQSVCTKLNYKNGNCQITQWTSIQSNSTKDPVMINTPKDCFDNYSLIIRFYHQIYLSMRKVYIKLYIQLLVLEKHKETIERVKQPKNPSKQIGIILNILRDLRLFYINAINDLADCDLKAKYIQIAKDILDIYTNLSVSEFKNGADAIINKSDYKIVNNNDDMFTIINKLKDEYNTFKFDKNPENYNTLDRLYKELQNLYKEFKNKELYDKYKKVATSILAIYDDEISKNSKRLPTANKKADNILNIINGYKPPISPSSPMLAYITFLRDSIKTINEATTTILSKNENYTQLIDLYEELSSKVRVFIRFKDYHFGAAVGNVKKLEDIKSWTYPSNPENSEKRIIVYNPNNSNRNKCDVISIANESVIFCDHNNTILEPYGPYYKVIPPQITNNKIADKYIEVDSLSERLTIFGKEPSNLMLFTYGYSGSGKTFTLFGNYDKDDKYDGVVFKFIEKILAKIKDKKENITFELNNIYSLYGFLKSSFAKENTLSLDQIKSDYKTGIPRFPIPKNISDEEKARLNIKNINIDKTNDNIKILIINLNNALKQNTPFKPILNDILKAIFNNETRSWDETDFIKTTANNPNSSRGFLFFDFKIKQNDVENTLCIVDMAGSENPYDLLLQVLPTYRLPQNNKLSFLNSAEVFEKDIIMSAIKTELQTLTKNIIDEVIKALSSFTTAVDSVYADYLINKEDSNPILTLINNIYSNKNTYFTLDDNKLKIFNKKEDITNYINILNNYIKLFVIELIYNILNKLLYINSITNKNLARLFNNKIEIKDKDKIIIAHVSHYNSITKSEQQKLTIIKKQIIINRKTVEINAYACILIAYLKQLIEFKKTEINNNNIFEKNIFESEIKNNEFTYINNVPKNTIAATYITLNPKILSFFKIYYSIKNLEKIKDSADTRIQNPIESLYLELEKSPKNVVILSDIACWSVIKSELNKWDIDRYTDDKQKLTIYELYLDGVIKMQLYDHNYITTLKNVTERIVSRLSQEEINIITNKLKLKYLYKYFNDITKDIPYDNSTKAVSYDYLERIIREGFYINQANYELVKYFKGLIESKNNSKTGECQIVNTNVESYNMLESICTGGSTKVVDLIKTIIGEKGKAKVFMFCAVRPESDIKYRLGAISTFKLVEPLKST